MYYYEQFKINCWRSGLSQNDPRLSLRAKTKQFRNVKHVNLRDVGKTLEELTEVYGEQPAKQELVEFGEPL